MADICDIRDLQKLAKKRVPRMFYEYADSGAWTESTYRANESAFEQIRLCQRVGIDISQRSQCSEVFGEPVAMPVILAPVGMTGMQHADGEIKAARAAEKAGVPFTLSTMSICSIVDAVGHAMEVHFDGGIRSGQDVFKALCLGASATYIGRAFIYGLGARGEAGVSQVLSIIKKELDTTMALCGECDVRAFGMHNLHC